MKQKTFAIYTLGCKLNFSESSDITRQLKEAGFLYDEAPDYIIVNTCAVTATAVKKGRNLVSRLHRQHPGSEMIVIGCFAALQPEVLLSWPGVSAVFGSEDKHHVIPYLKGEPLSNATKFTSAFSSGDRTRSFFKIQDGCDYHCSYCTVALARGESRSSTIKETLAELRKIADLGIKEVILTGVNLGDFGRKNGESLYDLLKVIDEKKWIERIRISSIEPNLLTTEIIQLTAQSEVIMPHFHIPLQSGSDLVLSAMKRRYHRALFEERILAIKSVMPDACIAVDVISGFPAESDREFEDSFNFIKKLPLSYLHVFTYSKRENTPAANMEQIKESVKRERTGRLLQLSNEKREAFYQKHVGETRPVLFESDEIHGMMFGFTDNYLRVKTSYRPEWANQIIPLILTNENLAPEKQ